MEQRASALLEHPLLLRGTLAQPRAGALLKQVEQPYAERTTIEDGRVQIEREGERRRRFSLRNAPELGALLASFEAMLAGDRQLLEQHYSVSLQRGDAGWALLLAPRDQRLARRVQAIHLLGSGAELRCMRIDQVDGNGSRMLVGASAQAVPEQASPEVAEQAFAAACDALAAPPGQ